ncbi:MAG: glycosyltransferase family 39 protein [Planctomycetota bacterium]|nr:glycosyltransferase family 39 protein [Planctomycetota bacterium]
MTDASGARPGWPDLLLAAACLYLLASGLGRYGLYEPHEGHFAGVVREMVLTGDYVTPHLNGSPYLNKPPLLYWSLALSCRLLGLNEFAARLPLAFYGWLGLLMAWRWARELWGADAGRLAAMMLATCTGWFLFTHQLLIDVLLSTLILASLYALWRAVSEPERKRWWIALYLLLALSWMAKGPMGALFVGSAGLGWTIVRGRWDLLRRCRLGWGLPAMLAPVLIWGSYVERDNPGFARHALINELVDRLFNERWPPDYQVSQVSVAGYLIVSAVWCAPWTLLLPWVARFAWTRGRVAEDHETEEGDDRADRRRRDAVLLLALGALGPVVFFIPVPSRLVYYCLPAAPPFALLVAGWWATFLGGRESARSRLLPGGALAAAGLLVFSAGFWVRPLVERIPDLQRAPGTLELIPSMAWLLGAALLAAGGGLLLKFPRAAVLAAFLFFSLAGEAADNGFRAYEDIRSSRRLCAELDPRLGPDCIWVSEGSFELGVAGGLSYYLSRDAGGGPRFVRVMVDDPRRPQPVFGEVSRDYELTREELRELWSGAAPVVFVTDPMRRDWTSPEERPLAYVMDPEAERLRKLILKPSEWGVEILGEPLPEEYGFRRVYANAAAKARLARDAGRPSP